MPLSKFEKFLPISGIIAGVLFALANLLPNGGAPDATGPQILQAMQDHEITNLIGMLAGAYLGVFLLFFAVAVRRALRAGEPGEASYSSAAFAGGIVLALSQALHASVLFSAMDLAEREDVTGLASLAAAWGAGTFIYWAVGSSVFLIATGLGGLRTATLPKWFGIVTVVLGVLNLLGPAGFLVNLITPLWLVATGIILIRRRGTRPAPSAAIPEMSGQAL